MSNKVGTPNPEETSASHTQMHRPINPSDPGPDDGKGSQQIHTRPHNPGDPGPDATTSSHTLQKIPSKGGHVEDDDDDYTGERVELVQDVILHHHGVEAVKDLKEVTPLDRTKGRQR